MRYEVTTSISEPDWLDDFKAFAHIGTTADFDVRLQSHLQASREWFEEHASELVTTSRDITLHLDKFPFFELEVWKLPVTAVTAIRYYDHNGDEQTLDAAEYVVDLGDVRTPCRIRRSKTNSGWPLLYDYFDDVFIDFTAGHAADADIPMQWRETIFSYAKDLYEWDALPSVQVPSVKTRSLLAATKVRVLV